MHKTLTSALALAALAGPVAALEDGELLIWINGDKGYNGLAEVGALFEEELGVPVKVEHPENVTD